MTTNLSELRQRIQNQIRAKRLRIELLEKDAVDTRREINALEAKYAKTLVEVSDKELMQLFELAGS